MSITKTKEETSHADDIEIVIAGLLEVVNPDEVEGLEPWMSEIKETARQQFKSVSELDLKHRDVWAVMAAAVLDAMLTFESRTGVSLTVRRMSEVSGVSVHKIRTAWSRFFDNRFYLDYSLLKCIEPENSQTAVDLIPLIVSALRDAVKDWDSTSDTWLQCIEEEATELLQSRKKADDVDPELLAAVAIYASMKCHHGKQVVQVPGLHLGKVCGWGEAKVLRMAKELFLKR